MTMLLIIIIGFAAGIVLVGAVIYVMAEYEQNKLEHGIERDCVHFRRGMCRISHDYCSPCSLYKTEEERITDYANKTRKQEPIPEGLEADSPPRPRTGKQLLRVLRHPKLFNPR